MKVGAVDMPGPAAVPAPFPAPAPPEGGVEVVARDRDAPVHLASADGVLHAKHRCTLAQQIGDVGTGKPLSGAGQLGGEAVGRQLQGQLQPTDVVLEYVGAPGYHRGFEPPWFAVGRFDGERVFVDKQALHDQVANDRNSGIRLCPFFDPGAGAAAIGGLPDTLAADDSNWTLVYDYDGKPAWIWPQGQIPPSNLSSSADRNHHGVGVSFGFDLAGAAKANAPDGAKPALRSVPPTRYSDVLGQNAAVEAARDLIELPLKHADIFLRIGAKPSGHGIILAGPPGTGKTLLARAIAGECGAHIEIVNGPALLSKWVGETEAAIRDVFERAQKFAPAVILFDEIDAIAPSRSAESAQHQVSTVAQLLVLLDGIEERGQIFVLATTNRPEHVDAALRRPGRFDQVVWMGLPDERGRADILGHYLRGLKLDPRLAPDRLAADLASATQGLTGADIAYLCQRAVMFCVKDRSRGGATAARRFDIAGLAARAAAVRAAGIYLAAGAT
jgi:hypothetical protein